MSSRPVTGRRNKRRTEKASVRSVVVKGFATVGVILGFVALAVSANQGVPGRDYGKVFVDTPETGSLRGHDRVTIGGVRVGQVVELTPRAKGARIELQLEPDVQLSADTRVRVRANGLLGARYVQLIPGSSGERLPDGATITGDETTLSSSVPDALDVFDRDTRGALGTTVREVGTGLAGNGEGLNDGIRLASDATIPFSGIMDGILRREGAAQRLVPALDSMMVPLDAEKETLGDLFEPGDRALRPFSTQRTALRETLDEAPTALASATTSFVSGQRLLRATGDLARSAHRTLPVAPAGLRETTKLLRDAREGETSTLDRASALLRTARPAVPAALRITRSLRPTLPLLDDALGSLGPIVSYVGRYGCNLKNSAVMLRSMTGFVGAGSGPNGPPSHFRLQAVAGPESLGIKDPVSTRDIYHEPCRYIGGEYPVTPGTNLGSLLPKRGGR